MIQRSKMKHNGLGEKQRKIYRPKADIQSEKVTRQ